MYKNIHREKKSTRKIVDGILLFFLQYNIDCVYIVSNEWMFQHQQ
jgi:hypothetical protein